MSLSPLPKHGFWGVFSVNRSYYREDLEHKYGNFYSHSYGRFLKLGDPKKQRFPQEVVILGDSGAPHCKEPLTLIVLLPIRSSANKIPRTGPTFAQGGSITALFK